MARKHTDLRFRIPNAVVRWETLTFWHKFKKGQVTAGRRYELLIISSNGLEFLTKDPPEKDERVLLNVILATEPFPFVMTGEVLGAKSHRGSKTEYRVGVKFIKKPDNLGEIIKQFGEVVI